MTELSTASIKDYTIIISQTCLVTQTLETVKLYQENMAPLYTAQVFL